MGDIVLCACNCGEPLPGDRHPLKLYINKDHVNAARGVTKTLEAVLCRCGCKIPLPDKRHSSKLYLDEQHRLKYLRDLRIRVREPIQCGCGCGEWFVPSSTTNKYANRKHQEHYHNTLAKEKKVKVATADRPINKTTMVKHATESVRNRNREDIDRQIGLVLAGDLAPIFVPPGKGRIK